MLRRLYTHVAEPITYKCLYTDFPNKCCFELFSAVGCVVAIHLFFCLLFTADPALQGGGLQIVWKAYNPTEPNITPLNQI